MAMRQRTAICLLELVLLHDEQLLGTFLLPRSRRRLIYRQIHHDLMLLAGLRKVE